MGIRKILLAGATLSALVLGSLLVPAAATAAGTPHGRGGDGPTPSLLVSGLAGASGSTLGPDGALYVTEGVAGKVTRIDPRTGATSTLVSGLPAREVDGLGGATDVAFLGTTAYVLVTLVGLGTDAPQPQAGIYRVDGPDSFTVVADIGAWSVANPPDTPFDVPPGLQFAMHPVRDGFLVTDGHLNRLLKVTVDGGIQEVAQFENVAPTGLATLGPLIVMAEAGPVPHEPSTGRVVALTPWNPRAWEVANGYSLLVDVEFGAGGLYALSQGDSPGDVPPGSPALPDSGELLAVDRDGTLCVVVAGLDLPTSVELRGNSAYVVNLDGEVWRIDGVTSARHGGGCGAHGYPGGPSIGG